MRADRSCFGSFTYVLACAVEGIIDDWQPETLYGIAEFWKSLLVKFQIENKQDQIDLPLALSPAS